MCKSANKLIDTIGNITVHRNPNICNSRKSGTSSEHKAIDSASNVCTLKIHHQRRESHSQIQPIVKYNCLIDYRRSAYDVVQNNELRSFLSFTHRLGKSCTCCFPQGQIFYSSTLELKYIKFNPRATPKPNSETESIPNPFPNPNTTPSLKNKSHGS